MNSSSVISVQFMYFENIRYSTIYFNFPNSHFTFIYSIVIMYVLTLPVVFCLKFFF